MNLEKVAALSIISSIELVMKGSVSKGSFLGKIRRLSKLCKIPEISKDDIKRIKNKIRTFEKESGWGDKERHIATLINFCLLLAENNNLDPKIIGTLVALYEYIDRKYPVPDACNWAASMAIEKWEGIEI